MTKDLHKIANEQLRVSVTNFGARLVSVEFKNASGSWVQLCAGFSELEAYERPELQYFGATVGRVAGRLAKGEFALGSKVLELETNEGSNHLHGGLEGALHNKEWAVRGSQKDAITLELLSPAGAGGFPGNVQLSVEYRLIGSTLQITQTGVTDEPTPLNLTNHAYWNLSGNSDSASEHELQILSDFVIPFDLELLPTGPAIPIASTELDFRVSRKVGQLKKLLSEPLPGYDHTYLLSKTAGLREVATLSHSDSGISMKVSTDAEALQLYTGNRNPVMDASGMKLSQGNTICLEAFGVNNPEIVGDYKSIILNPDSSMKRVVRHEFSARA